ncbi:MAG: hypothetical protein MJ230_01625 [bacterium]|nr:hypothetical protein [bacterium]
MTDKEKEIIKTFERVIPNMNEMQKEKLQSFGEGLAFMMQKVVETA